MVSWQHKLKEGKRIIEEVFMSKERGYLRKRQMILK